LNSRAKNPVGSLTLTDSDLLKELHSLIKPFHIAIMKLQQEKTFTAPLVYGEIMELLEHTRNFQSKFLEINEAAIELEAELKQRFERFVQLGYGSIPTYVIACLLDPSHAYILHELPSGSLIDLLQSEIQASNRDTDFVPVELNNEVKNVAAKAGSYAQKMQQRRSLAGSVGSSSNPWLKQAKDFVKFSMMSVDCVCARSFWINTGIQKFVSFN